MNLRHIPSPRRLHMPSRPVLAAAVTAAILGATIAVVAGTSSAQTTGYIETIDGTLTLTSVSP
jgi:hypothetical protein